MSKLIEPRTLRGFRDYPPALMIPRERVLETARRVYRSYGFAPVDTPALEYAEVLLGKGGGENDKIVYRFQDHGDRDVALRFDLTVPFARFAAQYVPKSGVPFKRYAMGPVWRGENTGHGRYREFWQCDFDTIGTTSNASDIETVLVINDLFTALEIPEFTIKINHRLILNGILEFCGLQKNTTTVLRSIDKLDKIGSDGVVKELEAQNIARFRAEALMKIFDSFHSCSGVEAIESIESYYHRTQDQLSGTNETEGDGTGFRGIDKISAGKDQLYELLFVSRQAGVPSDRIKIDLSIARGLDYYTGTIVETFLGGEATDEKGKTVPLASFGSVCSGGRYDNLASLYTKQVLPGVGASLGVDRLLAAMETMRHPWMSGASTPAQVLIVQFPGGPLGEYQKMARDLRAAGIATEVYPEAKKLAAQFQYADKRGFRLALIAGPDDFEKGVWQVKNLADGEQTPVPTAELVTHIRSLLGG